MVGLLFQYLPAISIGIIIVSIAAVIWSSMDKDAIAARNKKAKIIRDFKYPDFEMDLNRREHIEKSKPES